MMNNFRVFLSVCIFIVSAYFIVDLIIYSFDWVLLFFSLLAFVCAHYLWPPKYDGESAWYDALEVLIEFPYRAIAFFFRGLGKAFKDGDLDLDV
ncbi:hypothetical protein [uncultured Paraglaciecola sp.]|uniref:hypothetical protein n=1 Tax=uncultured Paraglaciecola sp. TaxID=1765024 RepID=UPI0030DC76E6|tara:strand:- start:48039 stop:48320 length:282 start_codon:yes stop_codon:yes gene_type:complete